MSNNTRSKNKIKRKATATAATATANQTKKTKKQSEKIGKQKLIHKGRSVLPGQGGYCVTCSKDSAGNHTCCRCIYNVHNALTPCAVFIVETDKVDEDGRIEGEKHPRILCQPCFVRHGRYPPPSSVLELDGNSEDSEGKRSLSQYIYILDMGRSVCSFY